MVEIALVKQADWTKQLVDLFSATFKLEMSEQFWRWKYLQNPLSSPESEIVVALDGERIVGARPFMLATMWLGNEEVTVAQHCDTMVHPNYQRRGIFNKMGNFALHHLKEKGFALSYGFPNPLSRPGFLKQGYQPVAEKETIFRIINPRRLFSSQIRNRLLARSMSFLYEGFKKFGKWNLPKKPSQFQIEVCEKTNDQLEQVYTLRGNSNIDLSRSESLLKWRFDNHPKHHYKYVLAKSGSRLLGFAVIGVQETVKNLFFGTIVDHVVNGSDSACYQALMTHCIERLKEQECDILVISTIGETNLRKMLLERFGFESSTRFPYSRFFSYGYMDVMKIDERVREIDVYDKKNWRVTHAFQDTA